MRVAWLVNRLRSNPGLLPGEFAGGGEMADAGMIAHAPAGVDVHTMYADEWESALDFDRIVIAATDQMTDEAMRELARHRPMVWVHHQQMPSQSRQDLLRAAEPFVCMSEYHASLEAAWSGVRPVWCHGWVDPTDVRPGAKNGRALWAARDHPQKGRIGARIWSSRSGVPLDEMSNAPRDQVLAAMSVASVFVFLPKAPDACPRTLLEAELAGCEIVTNHLAGRRDPGPIDEVLAAQPGKFWGWL